MRDESALFGDPDIGVGGVGQQEEVERVRLARAFDVLENRLHGAEHARGRLVVDRHHDRRSLAQARRAARVGPDEREARQSRRWPEVSESVTQENVTTNSTTIAHSSGVIVPTATTLNIWSAPYAVKARAPPKTKSRSQNRGAREARRDQRRGDRAARTV